jgi:hypothetical protein
MPLAARQADGDAFAARSNLGRRPRLTDVQRAELVRIGPQAAGFANDLWSCATSRRSFASGSARRTTSGISRDAHEARLNAPGPGVPGDAARQNDDRPLAIPRLASQKGARRRGATVVFVDETGFLLRPLIGRTLVSRGEPSILRMSSRQRRLSEIEAVTLSPRRKRINLIRRFFNGNGHRPITTSASAARTRRLPRAPI